MRDIKGKRRQIYVYIVDFLNEHGYPPTIREIKAHIGVKSTSTVEYHLRKLKESGLISQEDGKARSITVTGLV